MRIALFLCVFLLVFFSGCLRFKQSLIFNKDGTCTIIYKYSIPEEHLIIWSNFPYSANQKNGLGGNFLNRQAVESFFSDNEIELRQYRQYTEGTIRHVEIIVLSRNIERDFNKGVFGDFELKKNLLGDYSLTGKLTLLPDNLSEEAQARLIKYSKGLSLSLSLSAPTAIISSNGRKLDYRQVEWSYSNPVEKNSSYIFSLKNENLEATW